MAFDLDEISHIKERLARDIAGEIVLSERPEHVIRKWREIFKVSQKQLAQALGITPSVISDYESGRRKSPGTQVIKKYVQALLDIDVERGAGEIRSFSKMRSNEHVCDAIIDIKEFSSGKSVKMLCDYIKAELVVPGTQRKLYGYTVIDSLKAITEFSFTELARLYGATSQRALIFTKVETGRTPLVAIKLTSLHPGLVVLHGLDEVDGVAKRIAQVEGIPLAICRISSIDSVVSRLRELD